MAFKFMSTIDKTGSPSPSEGTFWTLFRGKYRTLTSVSSFSERRLVTAINSTRIWMLFSFLNFRCWITSKYCPSASLPVQSFLTTVFLSKLLWQSQWREPPRPTPSIVLKARNDRKQEHVVERKATDQTHYLGVLPKHHQHGSSDIPPKPPQICQPF